MVPGSFIRRHNGIIVFPKTVEVVYFGRDCLDEGNRCCLRRCYLFYCSELLFLSTRTIQGQLIALSRIIIDPEVRHGKPVIKGTRVPVDVILGAIAGGMADGEVAEEYGITVEDVLEAVKYAAGLVAGEEIEAYA